MKTVIETERLILREYDPEKDFAPLYAIFTNEQAMTYYSGLKSEAETRDWIEWNRTSYAERGYGLWAVVLKESGTFIGHCGLILQRDVLDQDEVEIGYAIHPDYWGKGFATEAALASKKFAFEKLNLNRVISLINPDNKPSIAVALKNGMAYENKLIRWEQTVHLYAAFREENHA